jgi:hypothetical protein
MTMRNFLISAAAAALMITPSTAHTWLEQIQVIGQDGNYTGAPGYPRGYIDRTPPMFSDTKLTNLIPQNGLGRSKIDKTDALCRPSQQQANSNAQTYPSLKAQAGDYIAAKYLENGHVTAPTGGKPGSGGLVYMYATTKPDPNLKLLDVFNKWTPTSDLSEGRLLAINNYDDGRCYQIVDNPAAPGHALSQQRQASFPDPAPGQPASRQEQWCETNFQVPKDAPAGSLAVYWVWQWPTLPNLDPGQPAGKDEIYSTCSDFQITNDGNSLQNAVAGKKLPGQDSQTTAVKSYKERAANLTMPADPHFYGPKNAGAPSPAAPASSGPAAPAASSPAPAGSSLAPAAPSLPPAALSPPGAPPFASTFATSVIVRTSTKTEYITVIATATPTPGVQAPAGAKFRVR